MAISFCSSFCAQASMCIFFYECMMYAWDSFGITKSCIENGQRAEGFADSWHLCRLSAKLSGTNFLGEWSPFSRSGAFAVINTHLVSANMPNSSSVTTSTSVVGSGKWTCRLTYAVFGWQCLVRIFAPAKAPVSPGSFRWGLHIHSRFAMCGSCYQASTMALRDYANPLELAFSIIQRWR